MKGRKLPAIAILLLALGIPVLANSGPKNWFHRKHSSSAHYQGHIVVKHQTGKHPKPHHILNPHN